MTSYVNETGIVQERYIYNAYGHVTFLDNNFNIISNSTIEPDHLYAGYNYDSAVEMCHVRNRVYHPTLGTWLQRDPIGYDGDDVNLMRYVANVPTRFIDFKGLKVFSFYVKHWNPLGVIEKYRYYLYVPNTNSSTKEDCRELLESRLNRGCSIGFKYTVKTVQMTQDENAIYLKVPAGEEKALSIILNTANKTDEIMLGTNKCERWVEAFKQQVTCLDKSDHDIIRKQLTIEQILWDNNHWLSKPHKWLGGHPRHTACRITFRSGEQMYLDQGEGGGSDHIFFESSIPDYLDNPKSLEWVH